MGGPDIWEIVRDLKHTPSRGAARLQRLADDTGVPVSRLSVAIDFYVAYPVEIDIAIDLDEQGASRARELAARRHGLLSS